MRGRGETTRFAGPPVHSGAPMQIPDLRNLRLLVVHPRDADGETLIRHCQRLGCAVMSVWPPPSELPLQVDEAIVFVDGHLLPSAGWLSGQSPIPLVAIIGADAGAALKMLELTNAHAVVTKPVQPFALLTNLILARNNFRYEKRLLVKISKLEETLRAFRKVEQAKLILMRQRNIRENEAYEYLRKQAMNKRVSVAQIASAIIDANELLG